MLLQHHDLDAGAPEEITEHHAGRAAADDAAPGCYGAMSRGIVVHDFSPSRVDPDLDFSVSRGRGKTLFEQSIVNCCCGSSCESS
jgi:hypothetical protein